MNSTASETTFLAKLDDRVSYFARRSLSPRTIKAYELDWNLFDAWCREHELHSLPADPQDVARYLSHLADTGFSAASIVRKQTSISAIHRAGGYENPTRSSRVSTVVQGIKKTIGKPPNQARPISWGELTRMVAQCIQSTFFGLRDAALMSIGWVCALRRSEIVALDVSDLEPHDRGIIVTIKRSKGDSDGLGQRIAIPRGRDRYCPVWLLENWLERRRVKWGDQVPLFTSAGVRARGAWYWESDTRLCDRMVTEIVKQYGALAGLPKTGLSAHSLRRGLATEAGARGVPERVIARHTRHRSIKVLRGYIDDGTAWDQNPLLSIYRPAPESVPFED